MISRGKCSWSEAELERHNPPITITRTLKNGTVKKYENVEFTVKSVNKNPVILWNAPEKITRAKLSDYEKAQQAVQSGTLTVAQLEYLLEEGKKRKAAR